MRFEPGPGTRTCKSASCADFPAGYRSPGCPGCAAERCVRGLGGAAGRWPLDTRGPIAGLKSELKEICPNLLSPGGLGGDTSSKVLVGWCAGLMGASGGLWEQNPLGV